MWRFLLRPLPLAETTPPAVVEGHGGLHHIDQGMGDVGDGPRVPQTLHTIERGISTA